MTRPDIVAALGRLAARLMRPDLLGLYAALGIAWAFYDQGAAALLVLAAVPLLWSLRPERPLEQAKNGPTPHAEIVAGLDLALAGGRRCWTIWRWSLCSSPRVPMPAMNRAAATSAPIFRTLIP